MTTLIAGLGYIGRALADRLHAAGMSVAGLTASQPSAAELARMAPYPVRACDIADAAAVERLARDLPAVASVVHCASSGRGGPGAYRAVYLAGTRNLLASFPGTKLLFTSSTSVYAQCDGSWVTEDSPAQPERETGRILRETEDLVLASGGVVARLAGIYGPGRSVILKKFLAGEAVIEGGGERHLNQAHRDDIVRALSLLLETPQAAGRIYNVCDDEPLTQRDCYAFLAEHFRRPLPPAGPRDLDRKRGWTDKRVSNARLRALGWSPLHPSFKKGLLSQHGD
jgi:nucleoside-diphosphate-sugar epimerase